MKMLILLIYSLISRFSHAESWPEDFSYFPQIQTQVHANQIIEAFNQILVEENLIPFKTGPLKDASPYWLDQGYSDREMNRAVFLKLGLKPKNQKFANRLIVHPDGFLFHFVSSPELTTTAFFYKFDRRSVENQIAKLEKVLRKNSSHFQSPTKWEIFSQVAVSTARAEICENPPRLRQDLHFQAVSQTADQNEGTSRLGACLLSSWDGFRHSAPRKVSGIPEFIGEVMSNPKEAWSSIVHSFENLKSVAFNIKEEIKKGLEASKSLPESLTSEIVCGLVAELGPDFLLMAAGGVGAAKLAVVVAAYIKRLSSLQNFLKAVAALQTIHGKIMLPAEFFKKLIRGEIPASTLQSIERYAQNNLPSLALGAAKCGL